MELRGVPARRAEYRFGQGHCLGDGSIHDGVEGDYSRGLLSVGRKCRRCTWAGLARRRNVHDMGRTVTHKRIICQKAYLEGKPTPVIARETCHSPEAVDNYVLDFARVYFATVQRGMSVDETTFAIQRPRYLVEEYVQMIAEFGLDEQKVYDTAGVQMIVRDDRIEPSLEEITCHNERREQEPIAGSPAPAFPSR